MNKENYFVGNLFSNGFYFVLHFLVSTEVQSKEALYSTCHFDQIRHQKKKYFEPHLP
jgi:hypothetical protein